MASLLDKVSDAVRKGTVGQEVRRSARWFQDKIKGMKGDLRNKFSSTNAAKFYRDENQWSEFNTLAPKPFFYPTNPLGRIGL